MTASGRRQEFGAGVAAILPLALAAAPFGLIFGAEAVRHGLSPAEAILMSATVFAGGSQFLAIGVWSDPAPWLALGFATLLVNLRHTLMAASLSLKMERFGSWRGCAAAFVLADEVWAVSERRAQKRPLTPAFYAGAGLAMYASWLLATTLGAVFGGWIAHPERFGLDFAFPAAFIGMAIGFARTWRAAPTILASAAAALATHHLVAGAWYVIAGAAAGMAAAVAFAPARAEGAP